MKQTRDLGFLFDLQFEFHLSLLSKFKGIAQQVGHNLIAQNGHNNCQTGDIGRNIEQQFQKLTDLSEPLVNLQTQKENRILLGKAKEKAEQANNT